ncbi:hypothetical protein DEU56DRAFT_347236 [Suillus clintonianus]|uniref:uncharacterized protein n=1 Tax=Suillus clintonianus TaxID=1904413 RepID=UPI001B886F48|nr:uncharacterized protein DEU56DRAFT_347236 [Suillus clintonianus]KAG2138024.1 hypothetical protein DEU56DRAFT_347236 [Suillus clintonianus]
MGVLPAASMDHIQQAYQDLMYDSNSPILDFYPIEFEQDLNGKKQEWEAIVKIPFIDEERLLRAMNSRAHRLTPEERRRNDFGTSTKFSFNPGESTVYPSSLPDFFPPIYRFTCKMESFDLPTLDGLHLVPGLCEGVWVRRIKAARDMTSEAPTISLLNANQVPSFVHHPKSKTTALAASFRRPYWVSRVLCSDKRTAHRQKLRKRIPLHA